MFVRTPELERDLAAYQGGTLHQRLEVVSKPSAEPIRYQLCLVHSNIGLGPACTDPARFSFDDDDIFTAQQALRAVSGSHAVGWQRGITSVMLLVRDPSGAPIDDRTIATTPSGPRVDVRLYVPMQVRFMAVVVPHGGSPPQWPRPHDSEGAATPSVAPRLSAAAGQRPRVGARDQHAAFKARSPERRPSRYRTSGHLGQVPSFGSP